MSRVAVLLGAALLASAAPAGGRTLWEDGGRRLDFAGSVREILLATRGTDAEAFTERAAADPRCALAATFADCAGFDVVGEKDVVQSLTRLRLGFDLVLSPRLSATLVYDHEGRVGFLDTLLADVGREDTFLGLEDEIHAFGLGDEGDHVRWGHRVYRGFVRFEGERVEATVGRQRLAWGVGRLWNPTDRFSFVPPLAVEADQSPGIDGVDLRWRFSGFDMLQAVYAPGTRSEEARYALRFQGVVRDADVSALAGVFAEAPVLGFDFSRNLGDWAVRLEAAWTDPEQPVWPVDAPAPQVPDDFWQVVVGADVNLAVGSGLYLLVEHLYNGNALGFGRGRAGPLLPFFEATDVPPAGGAPVPEGLRGPFVRPAGAELFASSLVVGGSAHLTGVELAYDLATALRGDVLLLWDWEGASAALFPSLRYDGWNAAELVVGAQLFAGPRRSEFGDRDPLVFVRVEVFF